MVEIMNLQGMLNQVIMLSTGTWLPMALISPAIIIAILAYYFKRMT
jgi:hypothetical protein